MGSYVVRFLNHTPMFDWYVVWWGSERIPGAPEYRSNLSEIVSLSLSNRSWWVSKAFVKRLYHTCALIPNEALDSHTMLTTPNHFSRSKWSRGWSNGGCAKIGPQMLEQPFNAFPKDVLVPTGCPIISDLLDARQLKNRSSSCHNTALRWFSRAFRFCMVIALGPCIKWPIGHLELPFRATSMKDFGHNRSVLWCFQVQLH